MLKLNSIPSPANVSAKDETPAMLVAHSLGANVFECAGHNRKALFTEEEAHCHNMLRWPEHIQSRHCARNPPIPDSLEVPGFAPPLPLRRSY
jgi:hypothetical protein